MKKLISSILALSLVAGMSVTAFAATTTFTTSYAGTGTVSGITWTARGGSANTSQTVTVPAIAFDWSTPGLTANSSDALASIKAMTPSWVENAASTVNASAVMNVNFSAGSTAGTVVITFVAKSGTLTTGTIDADYVLTDSAGGIYTVAIDGSVAANPTVGLKIDDVADNAPIGGNAGVKTTGMAPNVSGSPDVLGNLDIRPDSEIFMYLSTDDFKWVDSTGAEVIPIPSSTVTTAQLRTGKITIKKSVSKGSNTIENIEFDSTTADGAYVHIEFVEWFVSVNDQDVDFTVYLAHKGSKRSDTEVNIAGTMDNEQDEVDEGDDYISTEDGTVFEAQDYVRNCEVYLGNGVYITTNLFKDKKYYGIALNTYDTTDGAIMDEYPEIDNVITLKTVNLKGSGNIVTFDMSGDYYVYGADGTYLGLSSEAVAYSDKYYFATERISINDGDLDDDDDLILDEDDDDDYVGPSDGGGDDANNANDNPGTGVNGFVGVAVAAGLISLAAVGVTARKKK